MKDLSTVALFAQKPDVMVEQAGSPAGEVVVGGQVEDRGLSCQQPVPGMSAGYREDTLPADEVVRRFVEPVDPSAKGGHPQTRQHFLERLLA